MWHAKQLALHGGIILFIGLLCGAVGNVLAVELHRREVEQKNPGGKDLVMAFEEVSRDEKTSLARVVFKSGASVPASMFVVQGFYDIARARGAAYFVKLREWSAADGAQMYLVGFSNDKNVSPAEYFQLAAPLPGEIQFMSVQQFSGIFGARK